ncbi:SCO4225 family membrane protein [Streptosporangium sp. CA-135522]|uniref:SCO4225 family membrane protein n=1 Tax=Streptosporangium sp. CA-135522 TaxID=3240072 RepID=UPI003D91D90E
MTKPHKPGPAGCLALAYSGLVLALGVYSIVVLLTVQDPILLSGVALMYLTFPLGWLVWQAWDLLPIELTNPIVLILLLMGAGWLQAWAVSRLVRRLARRGRKSA